jgi:hypothetical protein
MVWRRGKTFHGFNLLHLFSLSCILAFMAAQPLLLFEPLCSCGIRPPEKAGFCLPCYHARWHSLRWFGGHREEVLARDGYRCRVCAGTDIIVHHRMPLEDPAWMITLCAGCHARVHRLRAIDRWVPELLLVLWSEQHPGPLQLQFRLAA